MSNKPKQVLLFQEDEKALGYRYEIPRTLSMGDIDVVSVDYDVEKVKEKFTLVGPPPSEGSVYYLHPYKENTYVHESLGEDYFIKQKLDLYCRVASLLGAKSITNKVESSETMKREIDANGKCDYKAVEAGIDGKHSTEQKGQKSYEINYKFEPQDNFDLNKNIDELRIMINKFNLNHEADMISMIDSRDSRNSGTSLMGLSIESEITSEYNRILDISARLKNPVFSVSTSFKNSLETVNKIKLKLEFEF